MKKIIMILALFLSISVINFAQENQQDNSANLYTFFVNIAGEQFRYPLIGFVNIASGNHDLPQIGYFNWNRNDFSTLQSGFVNTVCGDMEGLQMGFVNTVVKSFRGGQIGFVNTAAGEEASGLQIGFVNTAINRFNGAQLSFVNITKQLNGMQIGIVNYTDSIEQGIPIGLLSIVRNGGYKAVELGVSEISPFNSSFKIGVERFYTSFTVSHNPFRDDNREQIICGTGLGSIIQLGEMFYLNPEITSHYAAIGNFQHYVSIVPYFGYNILSGLSIVAGPSVVWAYSDKGIKSPFYKIIECPINDENKLYFGARMALRFRW
ncbi:MAG: hypothetical protein LBG22_08920 [Treponema sp.]|nr:hypothetical protein [Treponema sp.]